MIHLYVTDLGPHYLKPDIGEWVGARVTQTGRPDRRRKEWPMVARYFQKIEAHKRYAYDQG